MKPTCPEIKITCISNIWVRQMHFKNKGDIEKGHKHQFDHLTLLAKGSLEILVNNQKTIYVAPAFIYIKADKFHELVSLEEDTLAYCIHALRIGERVEDILDPESVPAGVSPEELSHSLAYFDVHKDVGSSNRVHRYNYTNLIGEMCATLKTSP